MAGFKHYSAGCRMIVDFDDDYTCIPDWNQSQGNYYPGQENYEVGMRHLRLAEMTTVSTEALVERFRDKTHEIRCMPNLIDPADWEGLQVDPARGGDDHLRVLYGGAPSHYGDITAIRASLEEVIRKQPVPWRLICFGALPHWLHDLAQELPSKVVTLPWVAFQEYPQVVAWGGFDFAIAPLVAHPFNETKSKIKWLEAGIQGIPLIASRIGPYATIPAGCAIRVGNDHEEWTEAMISLLVDADLRQMYRENAYETVRETRTLDSGAERLQTIIEEVMDLPRIETREQTRLASDPPEIRP
jgi:glycosyltransferase involved in cell wall biosynthesis